MSSGRAEGIEEQGHLAGGEGAAGELREGFEFRILQHETLQLEPCRHLLQVGEVLLGQFAPPVCLYRCFENWYGKEGDLEIHHSDRYQHPVGGSDGPRRHQLHGPMRQTTVMARPYIRGQPACASHD